MSNLRFCLLFLSIFLFSLPTAAETWQEANRESARLYNEGEVRDAAAAAERATELYEQSGSYSARNHRTLSVQAAQMWGAGDNYRRAGVVLRRTINFMEEQSDNSEPELINLWEAMADASKMRGEWEKSIRDRQAGVAVASRAYGANDERVAQLWLRIANDVKSWQGASSARRYLEYARAVIDGHYDENQSIAVTLDIEFAKLELELEHFDEAERQYVDIIARLEAMNVDVTGALMPIYGHLACLYSETDRPDMINEIVAKMAVIEPYTGGRPRAVVQVQPRARGAGYANVVDASVHYRFTVDQMGHAIEIEIVESTGNSTWERETLKALEASRFVPAINDGVPVAAGSAEWRYTLSMTARTPLGSRISRRR